MNVVSGRRLSKLAAFLLERLADPRHVGGFSMTHFFGLSGDSLRSLQAPLHPDSVESVETLQMRIDRSSYGPGVVACALGWAPYALRMPKLPGEGWQAYARRVFGIRDRSYGFLFGASWDFLDDTAYGAARRIERFVARDGRTPHGVSWWYDRVFGYVPTHEYLEQGIPLLRAGRHDAFFDICDRPWRNWQVEVPQALFRETCQAVAA